MATEEVVDGHKVGRLQAKINKEVIMCVYKIKRMTLCMRGGII